MKMGYDMAQITSKPVETKKSAEQAEEIKAFRTDLELFDFGDLDHLDDSKKAIIYNIAKSLSKCKCASFVTFITAGRQELQICFENESEESDKKALDAKQEFLSIVRGGLLKPSHFVYFISSCFHHISFYLSR